MFWVYAIVVLLFASSAYSIYCTIEVYDDLSTRHPSFETLVCYTGIGTRDAFVDLLGNADEFDCFHVPIELLKTLPRDKLHVFLNSPYCELGSLLFAAASTLIWHCEPTWARFLLASAITFHIVGWGHAFVVLYFSDLWADLFDGDCE